MQKTKKFRRLLAGGVAVLMLGVSVPVAAFATGDGTNLKRLRQRDFVQFWASLLLIHLLLRVRPLGVWPYVAMW